MKNISRAILSGLLLAAAWPTYGIPVLLFVAFVPLLVADHRMRKDARKFTGWRILGTAYITFFLWNVITTYWLYYSSAFGAAFAILVNSLLMAIVFWLYHQVAKRQHLNVSLLFFGTIWVAFEKLHLHWEFSWPWLNLGHGFSEHTGWIQWYEYTGTFGGSFWVLFVNCFIFQAWLRFRKSTLISKKRVGIVIGMIGFPIFFSQVLLWNNSASLITTNPTGIEVLILQPNIDPYTEKYELDNTDVSRKLFDLADEKITPSTMYVIAPETVYADDIALKTFGDSRILNDLQRYSSKHDKVSFLTGISFIDMFRNPLEIKPTTNRYKDFWYDTYNSAVMVQGNRLFDLYHKSKLVVGVENFPYQEILKPIVGDAMLDMGGTVAMKTTQENREVFDNGTSKVAPIICYESVYGAYVTDYVKEGAQFLAIMTNDAWWDNTQGHKQHLSLARLRSIETRRYIARSANTGISAIIDWNGNIVQSLGYEETGSIIGKVLPNDKNTFYVIAGDYIARIAIFVAAFIFLFAFFKPIKKRK